MAGKVTVDGKLFSLGGERFRFSGVTYGTFRPRADGLPFPETARIRDDFQRMSEAGFTVVRTYATPPDDLLEAAEDSNLYLLTEIFYPDWRYLVGASRKDRRRLIEIAREHLREAARRFVGNDHLLGLSVGNEIPADVIRWVGTRHVSEAISSLVEVVKDVDPAQLVTYANYPTAEFLHIDHLDFLTFNVFLESTADFGSYLMRLHHLAENRPLVIGELGIDAGADSTGEERQGRILGSQLKVARELGVAGTVIFSWTDDWWVAGSPVEGWHFGLTRVDRSERSALETARTGNDSRLVDMKQGWPSISVVICAYNASATIGECLDHTTLLDYPDLEIIVVDDGSTDDTAAITARFRRARLLQIAHSGLAAARNEGLSLARGEIVAFLDADAYPSLEWPYYLVLGFDDPDVVGVGGPNIPPPTDPPMAQMIALAPGGPTHVLLTDDRAEHIPGCNMAFRMSALEQIGGFDPIFQTAGDDVDICWRLLDRGQELGFHSAALVFHHPRTTIGRYLGQQAGYGRAEAGLAARHPSRYTAMGGARWRGRIYRPARLRLANKPIYRGPFASGLFQSVYGGRASSLESLAPGVVLLATTLVLSAPLAVIDARFAAPSLIGLGILLTLFVTAFLRFWSSSLPGIRRSVVGAVVGFLYLAQPLTRWWGRLSGGFRRNVESDVEISGPLQRVGRGVWLLPANQPRPQVAERLASALRRRGIRVSGQTGWEAHDGRLIGSALIAGELVTAAHPHGWIQVRVRRRLRLTAVIIGAVMTLVASTFSTLLVGLLIGLGFVDVLRGMWRTRVTVGRVFEDVVSP